MCVEVDSIDLIDSLNYSMQNQENLKAVSFEVINKIIYFTYRCEV